MFISQVNLQQAPKAPWTSYNQMDKEETKLIAC